MLHCMVIICIDIVGRIYIYIYIYIKYRAIKQPNVLSTDSCSSHQLSSPADLSIPAPQQLRHHVQHVSHILVRLRTHSA